MKSVAIIVGVACAAVTVQGFAPVAPSSTTTALQGSLFDGIAGMDLYAPKKDQNEYGARKKKKLSVGKIQAGKSYVPDGLTAKQYEGIRSKQQKKKESNYARNVAKAGVFEDYTDFYTKRGTDLSQDWAKNKNTLGHRFAKTKFDWAGTNGESFNGTTAKNKVAQSKKTKNPFTFGKKKK